MSDPSPASQAACVDGSSESVSAGPQLTSSAADIALKGSSGKEKASNPVKSAWKGFKLMLGLRKHKSERTVEQTGRLERDGEDLIAEGGEKVSVADFDLLNVVGQGSFGKVRFSAFKHSYNHTYLHMSYNKIRGLLR